MYLEYYPRQVYHQLRKDDCKEIKKYTVEMIEIIDTNLDFIIRIEKYLENTMFREAALII